MRVSHLSLYLEPKKYPFNPLEENGQTEWSHSSVQAIKTLCGCGCTDWTKHLSLIKTDRVQESNQTAVEGPESNTCHGCAEKAPFRPETKIMDACMCVHTYPHRHLCLCILTCLHLYVVLMKLSPSPQRCDRSWNHHLHHFKLEQGFSLGSLKNRTLPMG